MAKLLSVARLVNLYQRAGEPTLADANHPYAKAFIRSAQIHSGHRDTSGSLTIEDAFLAFLDELEKTLPADPPPKKTAALPEGEVAKVPAPAWTPESAAAALNRVTAAPPDNASTASTPDATTPSIESAIAELNASSSEPDPSI